MKKIISIFLAAIMIIGSSSMAFAGNKDTINNMDAFKQEILTLPSITSDDYEGKAEQLVKDTNPELVKQFIEEKLILAQNKMSNYTPNLNSTKKDYIDLGDNCYIKVTVEDTKDDLYLEKSNLTANTPGAETLWKDYGDRQFTVNYEVNIKILKYDLNLSNHYTLSSTGIKVRYGESWMNYSGLASGSAGSVTTTKSTAKVGETVSMNCIFTFTGDIEGVGITKNFKMYNKVKCSAIDKVENQVKVVQSWNGDWL